jgi:hypothetical protein
MSKNFILKIPCQKNSIFSFTKLCSLKKKKKDFEIFNLFEISNIISVEAPKVVWYSTLHIMNVIYQLCHKCIWKRN